jgi:hypothetical protein
MEQTSSWLIIYRPGVGYVGPLCDSTAPGAGMVECPVCSDEPDDQPEAVQRVLSAGRGPHHPGQWP